MAGFTLIELVIVIALSAILSGVVSVFVARPITAYSNVVRRAELVDAAEQSIRRMARDIQRAVPNSLRIKQDPNNSNRFAIEMVNIVEGMRYRSTPPGPYLDFTNAVTHFDVIGQFQFALSNATCAANNCRLVVYNTGSNTGGAIPADNPSPGANVYSTVPAPACSGSGCLPPPGSVTITPPSTSVALSNGPSEGRLTLSAATLFAFPSPRQRLLVVDTPITYVCDTSGGVQNIQRYWGYTINEVQPTDPTLSPLNAGQSAPLTKDVSACSFTYSAGSPQTSGMMTITLTLTDKDGETVKLIREVSVNNAS